MYKFKDRYFLHNWCIATYQMTFKMELNVIITLVFIYCVVMKLRLKKTKDKREIALKAAALPMVTKCPCTNTSKDPVIVAKDGKTSW